MAILNRSHLLAPEYLDLPSSRDQALAGTTVEQYKALAQRYAEVFARPTDSR